jgi:hypothetical protein
MKTPEGRQKDEVRKYLASINAYVFSPVQGGWGVQSVDMLACINGIFWGIEVKRPGKKPTVRQDFYLKAIEKAGGMTVWGTAEVIIARIEAWRGVFIPTGQRSTS